MNKLDQCREQNQRGGISAVFHLKSSNVIKIIIYVLYLCDDINLIKW